jgi:methionine sulfoxide reductase heme-binding subunit
VTEALWYLGRGTGVTSLVLLTIVVALGIASRSGRPMFGLPRFAVTAVHRNASLLAVTLLTVHVLTLLADPYAQLKLVDLVLPFVGTYRPLWLGLGTLAFDLILALVATSLLRQRLGLRIWRAVHWLAYAAWPVALFHGLGTGTDNGQLWLRATAACCVALVLIAAGWRVTEGFTETAPARARVTARPLSRFEGPR